MKHSRPHDSYIPPVKSMGSDLMDPSQSVPPAASEDARAALASRTIPRMTLSTAESPLTAPLAPLSTQSAAERAAARFSVEGNAVLTGGAGNLAIGAARALLEHGISGLCLMDLEATLRSSASEIDALKDSFPDQTIRTMPVDVTSLPAIEAAFAMAASCMPGNTIDVLCCFAGVVGTIHSIQASADEFRKVVDINLTGSFLCAQAAAKYMIASKRGGSILFTASVSAHFTNFPQPQAAYNVSKAGVTHLTRNLAAEWAVHGIRVNSISPGYMDTVLNAGDNLKELREIWASRCPMGRMGDPEELTGAVVLLCSKRAGRYITGTDLIIDGGAMCF